MQPSAAKLDCALVMQFCLSQKWKGGKGGRGGGAKGKPILLHSLSQNWQERKVFNKGKETKGKCMMKILILTGLFQSLQEYMYVYMGVSKV